MTFPTINGAQAPRGSRFPPCSLPRLLIERIPHPEMKQWSCPPLHPFHPQELQLISMCLSNLHGENKHCLSVMLTD